MIKITLNSKKKIEVIDITQEVKRSISNLQNGFCLVFSPHTTVALLIGENEIDLIHDYEKVAETVLTNSRPFSHCGHGIPNAEAHIFGTLHGCSVIIPIEQGKLILGKFQSILFFELDGPRERQIYIYDFNN